MKNFVEYDIFNGQRLIVFSSTRKMGSVKTNGKLNRKNIKKIMLKKGLNFKDLVLAEQIHGSKSSIVKNTKKKWILGKDALVTSEKNIFLGVVTADCLPIIIYDFKKEVLGVIHAGYKGILNGIVENVLNVFERFGSKTEDLKILIAPSICGKCYEVRKDMLDKFITKFNNYKGYYANDKKNNYLNLSELVKKIFLDRGIKTSNFQISNLCTKENDFLFSAKASKNKTFGEFITVAGML